MYFIHEMPSMPLPTPQNKNLQNYWPNFMTFFKFQQHALSMALLKYTTK